MTQNEHVYGICCRAEGACDVISGENVKTIDGHVVLNFKLITLLVSEIFKKNHFVTAEAAADVDDSIKRNRINAFAFRLKIV